MIVTVEQAAEILAQRMHPLHEGCTEAEQLRYGAICLELEGCIEHAVTTGDLRPRNPLSGRYDSALAFMGTQAHVDVGEVIQFLREQGMHLQAPEQEGEKAAVSLHRLVSWQRALLECWPKIAVAFDGKPTPRDAMRWLKKHGPRDAIPLEQPDQESMRWLDLSGNPKTVTLKSIQSRISEWRKAGLIPG